MKNDNKAFTLIELVIMIAIIAVITSIAVYGFGYLSMADSKKCANRINSDLSTIKAKTMAEVNPVNMFLFRNNGNYYVKYASTDTVDTTDLSDAEKVGNSSISIATTNSAGATTVLQDGSAAVKISISRKDGSYSAGPQSFIVSTGGTKRTVYLVTDTGKHFVE